MNQMIQQLKVLNILIIFYFSKNKIGIKYLFGI